MLRCGFDLKDAPRLWNKVLKKVLQELGLTPLQSDAQLYAWHVMPTGTSPTTAGATSSAAKRLVLIVSTRVDGLSSAGEEQYRRMLLAGVEKEF